MSNPDNLGVSKETYAGDQESKELHIYYPGTNYIIDFIKIAFKKTLTKTHLKDIFAKKKNTGCLYASLSNNDL